MAFDYSSFIANLKIIHIVLLSIIISGFVILQLGPEYHFYCNFIIIQSLLLLIIIIILDKSINSSTIPSVGILTLLTLFYLAIVFFDVEATYTNFFLTAIKLVMLLVIVYLSYNNYFNSDKSNSNNHIVFLIICVICLVVLYVVEHFFIFSTNQKDD